MASITIRNLDERLKQKLRLRAATHLRSMEDEVRNILRAALAEEPKQQNLAASIKEHFKATGGVELELPPRAPMREPPRPLATPTKPSKARRPGRK
jgi:antitoxin FitA